MDVLEIASSKPETTEEATVDETTAESMARVIHLSPMALVVERGTA
jgi:hypothetical protein